MIEGQPQSFKEKMKAAGSEAWEYARLYRPRVIFEIGKLAVKRELPVSTVLTAGQTALVALAAKSGDPAMIVFSSLMLATAPIAAVMENSMRHMDDQDTTVNKEQEEEHQNGFA